MKKILDWRDAALILICKKLGIKFKDIEKKLIELKAIKKRNYDKKYGDLW